MKTTLLNTAILTSFGRFEYKPISVEEAKFLVNEAVNHSALQSAIGHQSTADILSELLETPISVNRINYKQNVGEYAIVFKLRGRTEEGKILSRDEIEAIGYDFGLLIRVS